jgi:hypothetical protein
MREGVRGAQDPSRNLILAATLTVNRRSLKRNDTLSARQRSFVSLSLVNVCRIDRVETKFPFLAMFGALSGAIVAREK